METNSKKRLLKPWHGIILFALVIVFLIFGATPIQMRWGMYGVALTEIILLAIAAAAAVAAKIFLKIDIKEMFPVKKPKIRQVIGVVLLWIGTLLLGMIATLVIGFFFPEGLARLGTEMGGIFTSVPMWTAYIIAAIMPAICEEALHRGFILTTMKTIRKDWVIVLVMGLIFGIFHLDPYRFAATAILGMAITYVMLKTRNILMPALFHLINNSLSIIISFSTANSTTAPQQADTSAILSSAASLGSYLIIGFVIPFLILGGVILLRGKIPAADREEGMAAHTAAGQAGDPAAEQAADRAAAEAAVSKRRKSTVRAVIICSILSVVMLFSGIGIVASSVLFNPILNYNETVDVNSGTPALVLPFEIKIPRAYVLTYDLSAQRGLVDMTIQDADGKEVYNLSAAEVYGSSPVELKAGSYTIVFSYILTDIEGYYKLHGIKYDGDAGKDFHLDGDLSGYSPVKITVSIR